VYPERWYARLLLYLLLVVVLLASSFTLSGESGSHPALGQTIRSPEQIVKVRLPLVLRSLYWPTPFGVETNQRNPFTGVLVERAQDLGTGWVRFHRLSWRDVQPVEGGPYDWSVVSSFENELRNTRQAGMIPLVIVHHSPLWATINEPVPTDCGAVRIEKFPAFAAFMTAAVNRYKQTEFGVHYWELINEPDVDPRLVQADNVFGCWGDIDDPYYGGQHYGEMLKVVSPAIKAADPSAKVITGGLLLARPVPNPGEGHPELFLAGILAAGAAPHFDIVAYHAYPSYVGINFDYDQMPSPWESLGGYTLGKARLLRQIMANYGVSKPLFLNETALGCDPNWYGCNPAPPEFFEAQANYIVRTFTRGRSENIQAFIWYTLDGPNWRYVGLLDADNNPRPAYIAYQQLVDHTNRSRFEAPVNYGSDVEAYSFVRETDRVHVVWSTDTISDTIYVPQSEFLGAYDREGNPLSPIAVGTDYQFVVGFNPIYLHLRR
jgi:hypothetical protein